MNFISWGQWKWSVSHSVVSNSLPLPGKHTGLGCHSLPQGIILTQGLQFEPRYPALKADYLPSSQPGWVQTHCAALLAFSDLFFLWKGGETRKWDTWLFFLLGFSFGHQSWDKMKSPFHDHKRPKWVVTQFLEATPLPQNSWDNAPTHCHMKLPSL